MCAMNNGEHPLQDWSSWLAPVAREVEEFLTEAGWDQPPQLFALVPTALLVAAEPELAQRLTSVEGLTPVAQEPLDDSGLAETLSDICWPDEVAGCAVAQEIVVLPPDAEQELDRAVAEAGPDGDADELDRVAVRAAQRHPDRREARLVVAVLRSGGYCCLLRLRGTDDAPEELVEHPDLAPNMVDALLHTLELDQPSA
jgi:hypothetical protein